MKKIAVIVLFALLSGSILAQNLSITETKATQYPTIELTVYDRNPEPWKEGEVQLKEADQIINSLNIQLESPEKRKHKKIFILFENSHFISFDRQRDYLKRFIDVVLDTLSDKDKLYFTEFDWTLPSGNVLDIKKIYSGDKDVVRQMVSDIKRPSSNGKKHESTELNTAIIEALEFLHVTEDEAEYDKVVLLFSSEFSNIYNSIHTPESIILSALQKNIPIYTVRYPRMGPKYNLKKIVEASFGEHLELDITKDFHEQATRFKEVLSQINERAAGNQYVLSYTTTMGPGSKAVGLKFSKQDDPLVYESFFITPSYYAYVMMDGARKLTAIAILVVLLLSVAGLVYFIIRKRKKEKLLNAQKLRSIEDEAREREGEQNKKLEELKKEREMQKANALKEEEERSAKKAHEASIVRFRQFVRPPILIGAGGVQYQLAPTTIMGRSKVDGCDFVIQDPSISKKHGCILFERYDLDDIPESSNAFVYVDLGSTNGSFVNDIPVSQPVVLKNGDVLRLGAVHFTFRS